MRSSTEIDTEDKDKPTEKPFFNLDDNLKIKDKVRKMGGDYEFEGTIVCKFTKLSGKIRYVVEHKDGILHIFSGNQLLRLE